MIGFRVGSGRTWDELDSNATDATISLLAGCHVCGRRNALVALHIGSGIGSDPRDHRRFSVDPAGPGHVDSPRGRVVLGDRVSWKYRSPGRGQCVAERTYDLG